MPRGGPGAWKRLHQDAKAGTGRIGHRFTPMGTDARPDSVRAGTRRLQRPAEERGGLDYEPGAQRRVMQGRTQRLRRSAEERRIRFKAFRVWCSSLCASAPSPGRVFDLCPMPSLPDPCSSVSICGVPSRPKNPHAAMRTGCVLAPGDRLTTAAQLCGLSLVPRRARRGRGSVGAWRGGVGTGRLGVVSRRCACGDGRQSRGTPRGERGGGGGGTLWPYGQTHTGSRCGGDGAACLWHRPSGR